MELTCVDMGGSNLRIAQVRDDGTIAGDIFKRSAKSLTSDQEVVQIISDLAKGNAVSICCAGDIDEPNRIVRYSSNVGYAKRLEYPRMLADKGLDVVLTNDMRAAVMGEAAYGAGKDYRRVAVATFSSGANCAVADAKKVVTSAEFGHMAYHREGGLFCGCGAQGHLEPYVSGNGAATWARQFFDITYQREHPILQAAMQRVQRPATDDSTRAVSEINAADVYAAYRKNPAQEPQRSIRDAQVQAIAHLLGAMISAYNPLDIIILMGSQTLDWDVLFAPAIQRLNAGGFALPSLLIPPIVRTTLPEIGLQGAAAYSRFARG